ncbi:MAG: FtsX-like permease family protein [Myxococcota bacterium]
MIELVQEAWAGLMVHRVRSVLSGTGILFGVGRGAEASCRSARARAASRGAHLAARHPQLPGALPRAARLGRSVEVQRKSVGLSRRDLAALREVLPAAVRVGATRELPFDGSVPRPRAGATVQLLGADPDWLAASSLVLVAGRPLTALDEAGTAPVALLGRGAQRALFGAAPALGERLRIGETWLVVVGLFDDGAAPDAHMDGVDLTSRTGAVIVPLATALGRLASDEPEAAELTEIQVTVGQVDDVSGEVAVARRLLDRLHRDQQDYEVVVPLRLLEQSRAQQRLFNLVMGLIAGISLLVGGIGIMNIMLATVLERTREIGVRLAVGARPRDIARLFLVEASLISLIGGGFGVVAGLALARVVAAGTGWATAVSPGALVLALAVAVGEGLLFGWLPARRAAALPPVIAVRQG